MLIKTAILESGIPVKIRPFSFEMLGLYEDDDMISEIVCNRIGKHYKTCEYVKLHEKFTALCSEIESAAPDCKKAMSEIDNIVVDKEVDCFEAGYHAGAEDIMTALTFNDLQITHTQAVDMEAINIYRRESKADELADKALLNGKSEDSANSQDINYKDTISEIRAIIELLNFRQLYSLLGCAKGLLKGQKAERGELIG